VLLKYVLIHFITKNDLSLAALVEGITRISWAIRQTFGKNCFWPCRTSCGCGELQLSCIN